MKLYLLNIIVQILSVCFASILFNFMFMTLHKSIDLDTLRGQVNA